MNWFPTSDGVVLPSDPVGALARGRFRRVPTIVGLNRDEGRLFVALAFNLMGHALIADEWPAAGDHYFGPTFGPQVRAQYPLASYPDPGAAFGQAIGDAILACPVVTAARTMAKHTRVYAYEFVHEPDPFILGAPGIDLGAFHSAELPYVFAGPVQSSGAFTFTSDEERLVDIVTGAWTRLAARGRPAGKGLRWPRLGKSGKYLALDTAPTVVRDVKQDVCAFWEQLGWTLGAQ